MEGGKDSSNGITQTLKLMTPHVPRVHAKFITHTLRLLGRTGHRNIGPGVKREV